MKQITINIENDKYQVFRAFLESLDYAKIVSEKEQNKSRKKRELAKSINIGLKEVELIEKGELKSVSIKQMLDEI